MVVYVPRWLVPTITTDQCGHIPLYYVSLLAILTVPPTHPVKHKDNWKFVVVPLPHTRTHTHTHTHTQSSSRKHEDSWRFAVKECGRVVEQRDELQKRLDMLQQLIASGPQTPEVRVQHSDNSKCMYGVPLLFLLSIAAYVNHLIASNNNSCVNYT